jgi:hypothetical protein
MARDEEFTLEGLKRTKNGGLAWDVIGTLDNRHLAICAFEAAPRRYRQFRQFRIRDSAGVVHYTSRARELRRVSTPSRYVTEPLGIGGVGRPGPYLGNE